MVRQRAASKPGESIMINTFNKNIAIAAVLAESAKHMRGFLEHTNVETIDGTLGVDHDFNVMVFPARDGGGYSKTGIPVICGMETVAGFPAHHGTVTFIRKL